MILLVVTVAFGAILSQSDTSLVGPALRSLNDAIFPENVALAKTLHMSTPLETLTNALNPYFDKNLLNHKIATDLFAFIKSETIPEDLKPLLYQSYSYLAHYAKERNDKILIQDLFHYFKTQNHDVYADLLETAKYFIEREPFNLLFLFRIIELFERTFMDTRPGSDEFSIFLLRKLHSVNFIDVMQLKDDNVLRLAQQTRMQNIYIGADDLKKRRWFFSKSVVTEFPQVKEHMLKVCLNSADRMPSIAYTLLLYVGKKLKAEEQKQFIQLMVNSIEATLSEATLAKLLGYFEEYKILLRKRLARKSQLPPLVEATKMILESKSAGLRRAALDLWRISMGKLIYERNIQNLDELTQEYYATLKEFSLDFNDVIRLHVGSLIEATSEKIGSEIAMYLKNNWPIKVLEPLFENLLNRLDGTGALSLFKLSKEFPEFKMVKETYVTAIHMLSQKDYILFHLDFKLQGFLESKNAKTKLFAQVLLHVMILARNGIVADLGLMDWDEISGTYKALPALKPLVIQKPTPKVIRMN